MPHAWVNGNPEIEPWRSIDVAEKAFAFSGVELTVFLSGSEIWSPATVNGTETRCHQREMRVLMRWGNAARIESREGSAAPRNRKTSSYLHPDPQKNEESHKAELQSFKPLDKRGVNFYFLCLSMDVTHSILRGSTARFPRKTVRERLLASFYCGSGRRGSKHWLHTEGGPLEVALTHALTGRLREDCWSTDLKPKCLGNSQRRGILHMRGTL